jgi:arginine-tRNA-protein transferase
MTIYPQECIEHLFLEKEPVKLSAEQIDVLLSEGWYFCSNNMFRKPLTTYDKVYTRINIRFDVNKIKLSKSLRRIYRKNQHFRHQFGELRLTPAHEAQYLALLPKLQINNTGSLVSFLGLDSVPPADEVFPFGQLDVFDGDKLIACSFFNISNQFLVSRIGLLDRDEPYTHFSLGFYTMLLEIEYARSLGIQYYSPGYTFDLPNFLDYKLRLNDEYEVYDWYTQSWVIANNKSFFPDTYSQRISAALDKMAKYLEEKKINYQFYVYEYFEYFNYQNDYYVFPCFYDLTPISKNEKILLSFDPVKNVYDLQKVWCSYFVREPYLSENFTEPQFNKGILFSDKKRYQSANPTEVIKTFQRWYRRLASSNLKSDPSL